MRFFSRSDEDKEMPSLDKGMSLYAQKRFKEALAMFEEVAKKYDDPEAQYQIGYMHEHDIVQDINFKQAMMWYMRAAKGGHKAASNNIGNFYYFGKGVQIDYGEAIYWYKLATEQGEVNTLYNLGVMYHEGKGVPVNLKEAFQWYLRAVQNNDHHADSLYEVGLAYLNGLVIKKDSKKALIYLRSAAEDNHKMAQLTLGLYYMNGFGIDTDFKEAIDWLTKSDYRESLLCVAHMYEKGLGVDQDSDKAKYYYDRCSATVNIDISMTELGMTYLRMGEGEKSVEQALFWFEKAAEKNNVHALIAMGSMYMMGCFVDKKKDIVSAYSYLSRAAKLENVSLELDQLKARDLHFQGEYSNYLKWYIKSLDEGVTVEEGCVSGLSCLGYMYHKGLGVQRDYLEAFKIYRSVLENINDDDSDANMCFGLLYSKGLGVEQDHKKAMEYFKRSAKTINTYTYNLIGDAYKFGNGVDINEGKAIDWYMKGAKYRDGYSQLNVGMMYLDNPKFSVGRHVILGWFRDSYENGCREALTFILSLGNGDLQISKPLLNEREVAQKEVLQLKPELDRVKADKEKVSKLNATMPKSPTTQIHVKEKKTYYQFFSL